MLKVKAELGPVVCRNRLFLHAILVVIRHIAPMELEKLHPLTLSYTGGGWDGFHHF